MTKTAIIKKIKAIIKDYGSFGSGEVEIGGETMSPCVNEMGGLIGLAEYFSKEVTVEVYEPSSMSSDSMHSYKMDYLDLDIETLKKILELAKQYKADQS
ncbi:MAG TPA: hypothetical protein VMX17_08125 [Candidatus Glassbacteria bacterium]|nr:hypothetical protein [Candidatus Glassbacteria bacterium]